MTRKLCLRLILASHSCSQIKTDMTTVLPPEMSSSQNNNPNIPPGQAKSKTQPISSKISRGIVSIETPTMPRDPTKISTTTMGTTLALPNQLTPHSSTIATNPKANNSIGPSSSNFTNLSKNNESTNNLSFMSPSTKIKCMTSSSSLTEVISFNKSLAKPPSSISNLVTPVVTSQPALSSISSISSPCGFKPMPPISPPSTPLMYRTHNPSCPNPGST